MIICSNIPNNIQLNNNKIIHFFLTSASTKKLEISCSKSN